MHRKRRPDLLGGHADQDIMGAVWRTFHRSQQLAAPLLHDHVDGVAWQLKQSCEA